MGSSQTTIVRPRRRAILVFAAVLALIGGGCGSAVDRDQSGANGDSARSEAEPLGEKTAGSVAQLAQCRDWNRGNPAEKRATIEDIRSQVNLQDTGIDAPPLSDEEATELFDSACEAPYAQGFRLYIIYARGAASAPLIRDQPADG